MRPEQEKRLADRFWRKTANVLDQDGCWLWVGSLNGGGYGLMRVDGKTAKAHRTAWCLLVGEIPTGMHVLHKCDVRRCVNPKHLFLGTNSDNIADKVTKGRQAAGRAHGAKVSGERNGPRANPLRAARGESAGPSKLTDAMVREIRRRGDAGDGPHIIARDFPVTGPTVAAILQRKTWRHVR